MARFRAASGTAPVTVTVCPSLSDTVREQGAPARISQSNFTGTVRRSPFS